MDQGIQSTDLFTLWEQVYILETDAGGDLRACTRTIVAVATHQNQNHETVCSNRGLADRLAPVLFLPQGYERKVELPVLLSMDPTDTWVF